MCARVRTGHREISIHQIDRQFSLYRFIRRLCFICGSLMRADREQASDK
jgi:hypothetical protein